MIMIAARPVRHPHDYLFEGRIAGFDFRVRARLEATGDSAGIHARSFRRICLSGGNFKYSERACD